MVLKSTEHLDPSYSQNGTFFKNLKVGSMFSDNFVNNCFSVFQQQIVA